MSHKFSIAIHGGAGTLTKGAQPQQLEQKYMRALDVALAQGSDHLQDGGTSIEAVKLSVMSMEDSPLFNAGKGSVFNAAGKHEMDASIMAGDTRQAGAVCSVLGIKNPICLAQDVMTHSQHVLLTAKGAMDFAKKMQYNLEPDEYFYDEFRHQQWLAIKDSGCMALDHTQIDSHKFGTVGAVACDTNGHIAAATSTGGLTNKSFGRVGDTPIIGAGTYAHNATCAISCTGYGEGFMLGVAAYDVACLIEHKAYNLQRAMDEVIHHRLPNTQGEGGMIGVNAQGHVCWSFNTAGMYRAAQSWNQDRQIAIYPD